MRTSTKGLVIILTLYASIIVYTDHVTSHEVFGCSEENLPKDIKDVCTKLLRTKYQGTQHSKGVLQRTQQEQSSGVFREDAGIIQNRGGYEVVSDKSL